MPVSSSSTATAQEPPFGVAFVVGAECCSSSASACARASSLLRPVSADSHAKFRRPLLSINDGEGYGGQNVDESNFDLRETVQNAARLSAVYRHPPVEVIRGPDAGIPWSRASLR